MFFNLKDSKPQSDNRYSLLAILIFLGNSIAFLVCFINVQILHLSYPYNTYLFRPNDRFMDFFNPVSVSLSPYHLTAGNWQHMPFYYTLLSVFRILPGYLSLSLVIVLFTSGSAILFYTLFRQSNNYVRATIFTLILLTSYPIIFAIDRGNMEMILCIFFFTSLYLLKKERYFLSALTLSVTLAFKPFALFLLPVFLYKKRYWECLWIPLLSLAITLISIAHFPGSISSNYHSWMTNMSLYKATYNLGAEGIVAGSSIFGAIKLWLLQMIYPATLADIHTNLVSISKTYFYGAATLTILISYFVARFRFDFWKKVALMCCCMNMFPLVSGDYRLIHFLIPLYFWLSESRTIQERNLNYSQQKFDYIYLLLFALLLIPRNYYHFGGTEITTAAYTSPLIMILFTVTIFIDYYLMHRSDSKKEDTSNALLVTN